MPAENKGVIMKTPAKNNRPRPGLGRGLGALISTAAAHAHPEATAAAAPDAETKRADGPHVRKIPVADISRSPWQPRQTFDEDSIKELAESIKTRGVIQPLLCRQTPNSSHFELIAGERRLRAAIQAGLTHVPVLVMDAADRDAAEIAIIENIQREDLNPIEEAEGYCALADKFGLTQQEVADRVGKARASVANAMRLTELPDELKQLVGSSQLSTGHAKVLLSLPDASEQMLLGRKSVTDNLTVRSLERLIQRRQSAALGQKKSAALQPDMPESHQRHIADKLASRLGTAVRLTPSCTTPSGKHIKGCIEVDYYTNDDLTRLLELLGVDVE